MASNFRMNQLRTLSSTVFHGIGGSSYYLHSNQSPQTLFHFRRFSDESSLPPSPTCSSSAPPQNVELQSTTRPEKILGTASTTTTSSVNQVEVAKFSAIADTCVSWILGPASLGIQRVSVSGMEKWDSEGPFKPLHALNPSRVSFIRSTLCRHFRRDPCLVRPFEGLKFVDVGCGGGILSEPLARMGATVTGIDIVDKNIKIARLHADLDPATSTIEYCCTTAEKLVEQQKEFDAVIASEVIEHVANPAGFCQSLAALAVPNGATVVSSINRSMRAYATAIVAAEYILRWLPRGTHQWSSLLTPEELVLILQRSSISVEEMAGFVYNPLTGQWSLSDDTSVNYIAFGTKVSQQK